MLIRKLLLFAVSFIMILGTIMFSVGAGISPAEHMASTTQLVLDSDSLEGLSGITTVRKGDANTDGRISAADARFVLRATAQVETVTSPVSHWAGDVNNDNKLTALDARLILSSSADIIGLENAYLQIQAPESTEDISSQEDEDAGEQPGVTNPTNESDYSSGYVSVAEVRNNNYPMPELPVYAKEAGSFTFTTFGYGHGVGMSQYGAVYLADSGCGYRDILAHYFSGTRIVSGDEAMEVPETLIMPNGEAVETREVLGRICQREIAGVTYNHEALKAQVVAAYTYALKNNFSVSGLAYTASIDSVRQDVLAAVDAVWGEYLVDSSNQPIESLFFALSAGHTTWPSTVWGGANASYLVPVDSAFDRTVSGFAAVKTYTADEIRQKVEQFNEKVRRGSIKYCGEIQLSDNPGEWFEILEHDGVVSNSVGYVSKMRVGDQIFDSCAGQRLRADLFDYEIRSHCMIIEYYGNNSSLPGMGIFG